MAAPQPTGPSPQVLQWLHRVIAPVYTEPPRTYSDVATTLAAIPSLSPRTVVYTHEDGHSELLLQLSGTLPAVFRGQTFNVPITIWVPHQYPRKPPMPFITPPADLLIRPGNYVDPSGKCYHPYLANWVNHAERSSIRDLCDVLRDVFSREPPVMAKVQQSVPPPRKDKTPPPLPPLPPELGSPAQKPKEAKQTISPPPVPPLPRELTGNRGPEHLQSASPQPQPRPPPLPAHPHHSSEAKHTGQTVTLPLRYPPNHGPQGPPPPPLPPAPHRTQQPPYSQHTSPPPPRPMSMHFAPTPHQVSASPLGPNRYASPAALPNQRPASIASFPPHHPQTHHPQNQPPPKPKPAPLPDLLDGPIPASPAPSSVSTPAPPPPPNPEKDRLINTIASSLHQQAFTTVAQTNAALSSATSQHQSMLAAEHRMRQELTALSDLSELCDRDTEILKERIAAAERVIDDARKRELPPAQELVVPACVLHRQLYDLVAEDRAIEDTIYVLGKALDREKVGLEVFVKHVRTLAREQFLKRALAKKIADQLGLVGY